MITVLLVYLTVGSLIWVIPDGLGIIDNTFTAHKSGPAMVLATLMMIGAWPWFVVIWLRGMWRIGA
jgi:hypothetical protein